MTSLLAPCTNSPQPDGRKLPAPLPIDQEIPFVPTDEFDQLRESDEDRQLVLELTSRIPTQQTKGSDNGLAGQLVARNLPLLTAEEERVLFRRMNYVKFQAEAIRSALPPHGSSPKKRARLDDLLREAAEVRRSLAESNMRLVVSLAWKHAGSPHDLDEYVSEGLLILLGAIEKFDYSRGFRFSTYATHAIQRHFFRFSRRHQRQAERFRPTAGDMLAETAAREEPEEASVCNAPTLYRQLMASAKGQLSEREKTVLHRRFGTDGRRRTQTLREIAVDLGISKERVRQIQIAALSKLKAVAAELKLVPSAG